MLAGLTKARTSLDHVLLTNDPTSPTSFEARDEIMDAASKVAAVSPVSPTTDVEGNSVLALQAIANKLHTDTSLDTSSFEDILAAFSFQELF